MTYDPTVGKTNLILRTDGTQPEVVTSTTTVTGSWFQGTIINHLLRSASVAGSLCYLSLYYYDEPRGQPQPPEEPPSPPGPSPDGRISGGVTISVPYGNIDAYGNIDGRYTPSPRPIEVSAISYYRMFVTGSFTVTNASAVNTWKLEYPVATDDWGDITHFALTNGSQTGANSGSLLFFGALSASRTISKGDVFAITPGDLKITIGGGWAYASASRILNHYLNNVKYTAPAGSSISCALYSVLPGKNGVGGTEIAGTGYSRKPAGGSGSWTNPFAGVERNPHVMYTTNASTIIFSTQVTGTWGPITSFALWDEFTSKLLFLANLTTPVNVIAPDGIIFPIGNITVTPDNGRSDVS